VASGCAGTVQPPGGPVPTTSVCAANGTRSAGGSPAQRGGLPGELRRQPPPGILSTSASTQRPWSGAPMPPPTGARAFLFCLSCNCCAVCPQARPVRGTGSRPGMGGDRALCRLLWYAARRRCPAIDACLRRALPRKRTCPSWPLLEPLLGDPHCCADRRRLVHLKWSGPSADLLTGAAIAPALLALGGPGAACGRARQSA